MDLKETEYEVVDWILVAHGSDQWSAVVNTVMNLRLPQMERTLLSIGFSRTLLHGV